MIAETPHLSDDNSVEEESVRLPDDFIETVKKAGVTVYFASRNTTKVWNGTRLEGEPLRYGGWYWLRSRRGRVTETDEDGPFRSESAAIRDAFVKLQLRLR
jgi:hypothetical protein